VSGVSLVTRDISDRKRAEHALQELTASQERKVEERTLALRAVNDDLHLFTASVSHDLRSPLCLIEGYAALLAESSTGLDTEEREYVEQIRRGSKRMFDLIDGLLNLSRLGQVQVAPEPLDLTALVEEVVQETRAKYPATAFVKSALGQTEGDLNLLRQVWANLIDNAAKYTSRQDSPSVEIGRIEYAGERVFFVKDNGAGFDMKSSVRLFGLFQRMHHQHEYAGTGVGLTIVKRIVERHGGRIWAEAAPGKGATFYFTLGDSRLIDAATLHAEIPRDSATGSNDLSAAPSARSLCA
jgi:light-regulated signal transduction histidine kinase (bacteriophytochrome)